MDCPAGQTTLRKGDVLTISGQRHIVRAVNDSGARIVPFTKKRVTIENKLTGESATFEKAGASVVISKNIERSEVLERLGEDVLKDFLSGKRTPTQEQQTEPAEEKGETMETMTKRRPRGGLYADKLAAEAKTTTTKTRKRATKPAKKKAQGRGRLNSLFGHSVCSVMMAAGKAGATFEQATAVLSKHRIKASDATVKQNLAIGKSGKRPGADLTKEQLAEFGV